MELHSREIEFLRVGLRHLGTNKIITVYKNHEILQTQQNNTHDYSKFGGSKLPIIERPHLTNSWGVEWNTRVNVIARRKSPK